MLKITLKNRETLKFNPHRPPNVLNGRGDNWGNGSIDWLPDGLFLYEIVEQIYGKHKIVAAMRDDQYITMNTFVDEDCTLRFVLATEPEGQAMLNNTAKLLVNYTMHQLYPNYESLKSDTPMLYSFVSPDVAGLSKESLENLNAKLATYKVNPPVMKSYLMSYNKAVKQIAQQGSISQAKYLMAQENLYPLYVHEIDGFIQISDGKPLIAMDHIETLSIVSQEVLMTIGTPIIQLNVNIK